MSDPPTANAPRYNLRTRGATSMSACVSPSLSRTPADPVSSNQTNNHRPKKRQYRMFNLYQLSNDPDRRIFSDKLIMLHIERGTPIIECPIISQQPLDFYEIYLAVKEKGGFLEVTKGEMWKEIAGFIGISTSRCKVHYLGSQYIKYLLPFEYKYDRGGIDPDGVLARSLLPDPWTVNDQTPGHIFENRRTDWPESVSPGFRHHMVQKIAKAMSATTHVSTIHDTTVKNPLVYAHKVEADLYDTANSREEYYQMLQKKFNELREERQNGKTMQLQQVGPGLKPMIENNSGAPSPKANEVHPMPGFDYKVLQDLKNLLLSGEFSDVIMQVEDQQFKAHRSILAARSSVFAAMFRHDMKEKATGIVNVEDCELTSFPVFLEYLYCGSTEKLSSENVFHLFVSADKYDIQDLKKKCLEFMKSNITVDTIYETLQIALQHSDTDLLNSATEFFIRNFLLIIPTTKWETFLSEYPEEGDRLFKKVEETYK